MTTSAWSAGAAAAGRRRSRWPASLLADIDVGRAIRLLHLTVLITLEDYGFCAKGEGGPFVSSGVLGPGGTLKLNTGGGQLSGYYMGA